MASVIIGGGDRSLITGARGNVVYTKRGWEEPWELVPHLYCQQFSDTISPTTSSATLEYYFGLVLPAGDVTARQFSPSLLVGNFVQIWDVSDWGSQPVWTGIVTHEETELYNDETRPAGVQRILCVGLEDTLDKIEIIGSYTTTGRIDSDIVPNSPTGTGETAPNMVYDSDGYPIYCTPYHPNRGWWTHLDFLNYLIRFYFPQNILWAIDNPDFIDLLGILSAKSYAGYTVRQCLDSLFDRRKGLGWQILVRDGVAHIRVVSDAVIPVVAAGAIVPANDTQIDVAFDGSRTVKAIIKTSDISFYDGVTVLGGSVYTTATYSDANMGDSVAVRRREYEPDDDVPLADTDEPEPPFDPNNPEPESKVKFTLSLYSRYLIDPNWDWVDPYLGIPVLPGVSDYGELRGDLPGSMFFSGKQFERFTPFKNADGDEQPPGVYAYTSTGGWRPLEMLGGKISYHIVEGVPGIQSPEILGGGAIGYSLLDGVPGIQFEGSDVLEILKNIEKLIFTATIETDKRLSVHYHLVPVERARNIKIVHMEEAIAHWVVPGTVIDTTYGGELVRYGGFGEYYTDADQLRSACAKAVGWYCTPRKTLELEAGMITHEYMPGLLVRNNINGTIVDPINTLITNRIINYVDQSTTVSTSFDEVQIK